MEYEVAIGNSRKRFLSNRTIRGKTPNVSKAAYEAEGSPIHNLQRILVRWLEHSSTVQLNFRINPPVGN